MLTIDNATNPCTGNNDKYARPAAVIIFLRCEATYLSRSGAFFRWLHVSKVHIFCSHDLANGASVHVDRNARRKGEFPK
jgi:hypothetical protein